MNSVIPDSVFTNTISQVRLCNYGNNVAPIDTSHYNNFFKERDDEKMETQQLRALYDAEIDARNGNFFCCRNDILMADIDNKNKEIFKIITSMTDNKSNTNRNNTIIVTLDNNVDDYNIKNSCGDNILICLCRNYFYVPLEHCINKYFEKFSQKIIREFVFFMFSHHVEEHIFELVINKCSSETINMKDSLGRSIIMTAIDNSRFIDILIKSNKVDMTSTNIYGLNPLMYALKKQNFVIMHKILTYVLTLDTKQYILNQKNKINENILHISLLEKYTYINVIKMFLETKSININAQNNDGKTPLYLAIEKNNLDIVELLLEESTIDINISDNFMKSPLMVAYENNFYDIVFMLLARDDININFQNVLGETIVLKSYAKKYADKNIYGLENLFNFPQFSDSNYAAFPSCFDECIIQKDNKNDIVDKINGFNNQKFAFHKNNDDNTLNEVIIYKILDHQVTDLDKSDIYGNTPFLLIVDNLDIESFNQLCNSKNFVSKDYHIDLVERKLSKLKVQFDNIKEKNLIKLLDKSSMDELDNVSRCTQDSAEIINICESEKIYNDCNSVVKPVYPLIKCPDLDTKTLESQYNILSYFLRKLQSFEKNNVC